MPSYSQARSRSRSQVDGGWAGAGCRHSRYCWVIIIIIMMVMVMTIIKVMATAIMVITAVMLFPPFPFDYALCCWRHTANLLLLAVGVDWRFWTPLALMQNSDASSYASRLHCIFFLCKLLFLLSSSSAFPNAHIPAVPGSLLSAPCVVFAKSAT